MNLIEKHSISADPQSRRSEHLVYADHRFCAVIAGSPDSDDLDYEGLTGGEWVAERVIKTLRAAVDEITPEKFSQYATERIAGDLHRTHPHTELEPGAVAPPAASVCVYSAARREIWRIGDCQWWVRADGVEMSSPRAKDYTTVLARARAALVRMLLREGHTREDVISQRPDQKMIQSWTDMQHWIANEASWPYSYAVLNGTEVPREMVEITPVPAEAEVVMATAGYPELCATAAASEFYLQEDLAEDPLRIGRHPALSSVLAPGASFSDRAYLRFET